MFPIAQLTSLSLLLLSVTSQAEDKNFNQFDLSNLTIEKGEIKRPLPKDAIPAINAPKFTPIKDMQGIADTDLVLSFSNGDIHRAYPLRILDLHEVVNDTIGDKKVSITFCPLCGSGIAFDRSYDKNTITLGVSGLLYRSDVLLYDKETQSLWSQLKMEAVAGKYAGTKMKVLECPMMTYAEWKKQHPTGEVLNFNTGFHRPYNKTAYKEYKDSEKMHKKYGLNNVRDDLPVKTWVIGIKGAKDTVCISQTALEQKKSVHATLEGKKLIISSKAGTVTATLEGKAVPTVRAYWFAWQAFYPKTTLLK